MKIKLPSFFNQEEYTRKRRTEEANERFNIRCIDGVNVITYGGVVISRRTDDDLIARINELREEYINN